MNRINKYLFVPIVTVWLVQSSISSGISISQTIMGPEESDLNISNERIYLHIDREIYITGENLFFKVYLYNEEINNLSDKSKIAYIIICSSNDKQITQQCIALSGGMGYGCLPLPDTLKTGTYQVIAYTNWMKNFGESTFFNKKIIIANRFDEELISASLEINNGSKIDLKPEKNGCLLISTDQESYLQREKVTLQLSLPMNNPANVSISVAEKPPERYYTTSFVETLSLKHNNTPDVTTVSSANRKICEYLIEDKGFIISGFVHNTKSSSGIIVALSTPDTIANLKYAITGASGRFFFQLDEFYYNKELYINIPDQNKGKESVITLNDKFVTGCTFALPQTDLSNQSIQFIKKSQTIASINRTYQIHNVNNEIEPGKPGIRRKVYYEPDYRVLTEDYIPLKDFTEIVRETLPYIKLRKNEDTYEVEIFDSNHKVYLENPAIFLNGMLVNNINYIVNFGSDKIHRIETICHKRIFGLMEFNGILSVFTSGGLKNDMLFDKHTLHLMPITFLNYSFYTIPEYSTREKLTSRKPDFRQLLYWNPSVEIQEGQTRTIEFYTSDNKGNYIINIEGIASDGSPINNMAYFDVK
jgi:hypothetical protein